MNPQTDFIQKISKCVTNDTFVRLTLSKNVDRSASLKKVLIKLALIKKELQYSFVYRHETQDITKNFSIKNGEAELEKIIGNEFWVANFFTTKRDFVFEKNKKGKINLREGKPTFPQKPDRQHDKDKTGLIQKATYLQELGILDDKNRVQKGKSILEKELAELGLQPNSRIIKKLLPAYDVLSKDELYSLLGSEIITLENLKKV